MPGFEAHPLSLTPPGSGPAQEYTELYQDPLGEFLPESRPVGGSKRLIRIEPAGPMSVDETWSGPCSTPREPRGRWFIGWVMLGVGLVAGFVAGVAVLWNSFDGTPVIRASPSHLENELGNNDVPVPPSLPPLKESPDGQSVDALSKEARPSRTPIVGSAVRTGTSQEPSRSFVTGSAGPGLFVQSMPSGAGVYLDGQPVSTTPFQLPDIAPGTYTIRIVQPGYREWSASVNVQPGAGTRINASLDQEQVPK